jgi:two-component system response regulator FlrC
LRNRKEDIPLLADHFVRKFCPPNRNPLPRFSSQSLAQMAQWDWPGNVRELENMVERALLLCDDSVIGHDFLMLELQNGAAAPEDKNTLVGMTVKEMEKRLIGQTLKHVYENRTYAAKMLGISIRTLRNKLKEYHDLQDAADDDGNGQG